MNRKISILFFSSLLAVSLHAGVNSGFDILRTDVGARPAALGGAYVAMIEDIYGLAYNPASLSGLGDMEATVTYVDQFIDFKTGFIGFSKWVNGVGQLSVGALYTNYGELRKTDIAGNDLGGFTPGDIALAVSYSNRLPMGLRYGVSLKYVYSRIEEYSAGAVAADLGVIYRIESQDLNIGLSIRNLGASIDAYVDEHEKVPMIQSLGVSKRLAHLPLLLNVSVNRFHNESSLFWALGGEFTITDFLLLRLGYNSRGQEQNIGADEDRFAGVSAGLGFRLRSYRVDLAFCSHGALGMMNHFSVSIPF